MRFRWEHALSALAVVAATGCSDEAVDVPVFRMTVVPPSDTSCIGVSGFEVELKVGETQPRSAFVQRIRPVLARDECVIERATAFGDVDLDAPVQVEIRGYDGARQLRVRGVASYISLREQSNLEIVLEPAGVAAQPVVAMDRTQDVLAGNALSAVTSMQLGVPGQPELTVPVDENTRPYFEVGEPWAVTYPGLVAAGDEVMVKVQLEPAGVLNQRLVVEPAEGGEYLIAKPR